MIATKTTPGGNEQYSAKLILSLTDMNHYFAYVRAEATYWMDYMKKRLNLILIINNICSTH